MNKVLLIFGALVLLTLLVLPLIVAPVLMAAAMPSGPGMEPVPPGYTRVKTSQSCPRACKPAPKKPTGGGMLSR